MKKRIMAIIACLAMVVTLLPAMTLVPENVSAATSTPYVMPSHNGLTNNTTFTLGKGTDAEVPVYADFRPSLSTKAFNLKYIMIHNTGTYVGTGTAKNVHTNTNKTSSSACWHYTVDEKSIYQGVPDKTYAFHAGTSRTTTPSSYNALGIEMCVNYFPATETFGGEQWSKGTEIMNWYEERFNQTMKNTAYLVAVLCARHGLNYETAVKMHYDALQYDPATNYGKDCPMQMRATYDPNTNTFKKAGYYTKGRDGYFWQIFWGYLEAYASGAQYADDNSATTATRIGTYQVTPSDGLNVRAGTSTSYDIIGAFEQGAIIEATEIASNGWGKVKLPDGQEGWCSITNNAKYIGIDALAYDTSTGSQELAFSRGADGAITLRNNSATDQAQFDMKLPQGIGTATTPHMNLQVQQLSGSGFFFGITQAGSGYWMMRDCNSGDQLVKEDSAPYMIYDETLSICIKDWWKPEDKQQIDQVRFYLAPNSSIKINYFYFTVESGTVVDPRYNLRSADTNITLMQPDTLGIVSKNKTGSYTYNNGMLTVTADTAEGYEVMFDVNETFDVNTFKRFLIDISADVPFDVELTVTHAGGEGKMSLTADFYPGMNITPVNGFIPAWTGTSGLDIYGYYNWNNVIPADGKSTVTMVTVKVGGAGTVYVNSLQLAEHDRLVQFRDGVTKSDSSVAGSVDPEPPVNNGLMGDADGNNEITTADARMVLQYTIGSVVLTEEQKALCDFDGDGSITTADARDILISTL